jgi:hypothetical protein
VVSTDIRMRMPPPTTEFDGLHVTLVVNQPKVKILDRMELAQGDLKDWLDFLPQQFLMLGLVPDTCSAVIWLLLSLMARR